MSPASPPTSPTYSTMDTYNEWIGPNIITPPTTSESFTLDFKQYGESLGQPEAKILLSNRWGVKVYPVWSRFDMVVNGVVQRDCGSASDVCAYSDGYGYGEGFGWSGYRGRSCPPTADGESGYHYRAVSIVQFIDSTYPHSV